jgi:hypothetical protein
VGRNPRVTTHAELAAALPALMLGFANVPESRWMEEAKLHYTATPDGLRITYDPTLRDSFLAAFDGPPTDLWPLFEACADLPIALIRGANSDLLTQSCADEMRARRPDMGFCNVPDRAHIPFLDEAATVAVLRDWLGAIKIPATAPS